MLLVACPTGVGLLGLLLLLGWGGGGGGAAYSRGGEVRCTELGQHVIEVIVSLSCRRASLPLALVVLVPLWHLVRAWCHKFKLLGQSNCNGKGDVLSKKGKF
jgi:hypothetical protein